MFVYFVLETEVSFEKGEYKATESDGFVEVTLKLTEPMNFTSILQLEAIDTTGELIQHVLV